MLRVLAFSVFNGKNMQRNLSDNRTRLTSNSSVVLVAVLLFLSLGGNTLQAQETGKYHFGVRGGLGMSTLSGFKNNGLRLGVTAGVYGDYNFNSNNIFTTELYYSMGGQQQEKWVEQGSEKVKTYNRYRFHYLNIPFIYQHYFSDILGVEGGLNFRYCLGGSLKTRIGNENWQTQEFDRFDYNTLDMGLILGVYTDNLIPQENFFVSLRAYFGFLDVVRDVGSNKNISVYVGVGYQLH